MGVWQICSANEQDAVSQYCAESLRKTRKKVSHLRKNEQEEQQIAHKHYAQESEMQFKDVQEDEGMRHGRR